MVTRGARLRIGLFLAILILSLVRIRLPLLPTGPLAGVEKAVEHPPPTLNGLWSGRFQQAFESWFARWLPGREHLVRTDNQISVTLFCQAPSGGTPLVLGRGGTVIEKAFLDEYNRPRRPNRRRLAAFAKDVRRLEDLLARRGKQLILVIAPSKVEIYPELNPPRFVLPGRSERRSAYEVLAPLLEDAGVTLIDGHRLFLEERTRSDTPVFARGGTHWNHYGGALVASRLLAALDRLAPGRFVQLDVTGARTDREVWVSDDDLGALLNLWWPRPWPGPQTHPVVERRTEGRVTPRLLFVGDSFTLTCLEYLTGEGLMEPGETLYYFKRRIRYPGEKSAPLDRASFDMARELRDVDAVVLVSNEYWLHTELFGFVAAALGSLEDSPAAPAGGAPGH